MGFSEDVSEVSSKALLLERDRQTERPVVHRHRRDMDGRAGPPLEAIEISERDRAGQLAGAVRTEVEEDDGVAVLDWSGWRAICRGDHDRPDEFVSDPGCVRRGHRLERATRSDIGDAADDRVVGERSPLPPLVTVHRVVATDYGGDSSRPDIRERFFELRDIPGAAGRRRVAAVCDRVHEHAWYAPFAGEADQRVQMPLVTVDAAV